MTGQRLAQRATGVVMHTHTRTGSRVRIHVNGDWSGDAIVQADDYPAVSDMETTVPAQDLLLGKIRGMGHELTPELWCEAVSIAVEAYMREKAAVMMDDLHISEDK